MTVRTFWTIFIKILGIWLVLDSITIITQFLPVLPFFGSNSVDNIFVLAIVIGLLILTMGIYMFILRLFVFKTSWLINKLHLDKGFEDEKLDFNVQLSTVLTVATIVIGGLIFVDGLPQLCRQIFVFFQQKNLFRENPTSAWIIFYFAKTIIGYLLMTNSKYVVKLIEQQTEKQSEKYE